MARKPDGSHKIRGIGMNGQARNIVVPDIIGWKNWTATYRIPIIDAADPGHSLLLCKVRQNKSEDKRNNDECIRGGTYDL